VSSHYPSPDRTNLKATHETYPTFILPKQEITSLHQRKKDFSLLCCFLHRPPIYMCKKHFVQQVMGISDGYMSQTLKNDLENVIDDAFTKVLKRHGANIVAEGAKRAMGHWVGNLIVTGAIGLAIYTGIKAIQFGTIKNPHLAEATLTLSKLDFITFPSAPNE
jgi:hypothetical protein